MELSDVIKIYDYVAMHSEKVIWIQKPLDVFHGVTHDMTRINQMHTNLIAERL
jgi:hypothetical protein